MADTKPPVHIDLTWEGGQQFTVRERHHAWTLDGRNEKGPSPVAALGAALAGCMAIDVVHILARGRHHVGAFTTKLTGLRADQEPRRYVRIDLEFILETAAPPDQIERAIALSREKYCSVWHSMRPDIELFTTYRIVPTVSQ